MLRFLPIAVLLGLTACAPKKPPQVAVVPPAPQPAPPKPEETVPISFVQNTAVLPLEQAIPAGAVPNLEAPAQPESRAAAEVEGGSRRRGASPAGAPRKPAEQATVAPLPATPPATSVVPPATPPATAPAPTRSARTLSDSNAPSEDAVAGKIADVQSRASRISSKGLRATDRRTYQRLQNFIKLAEQALSAGETRQANELADRAATLARALNDN